MHSTSILVSTLLIAGYALAGSPPACLLSALNTQPNPADVASVCGNSAAVENAISSGCGANVANALSVYVDICSAKGIAVPTALPSTAVKSAEATSTSKPDSGTGGSGMSGTSHNDNAGNVFSTGSISGAPSITSGSLDTGQTSTRHSESPMANSVESGAGSSSSPSNGSGSGGSGSSGSGNNSTGSGKKSTATGNMVDTIELYSMIIAGFVGSLALLL